MRQKPKERTIGERIKEVFTKRDISISQFAERLNCNRVNVYNIFRRKKIDFELLSEISKILDHDFIEEIHKPKQNIPVSKISIVLDINNIDNESLNRLLKTIKQLEIKAIHKGND